MNFKHLVLVSFVLILPSCYSKNFDEPGRIEVDAKPTEKVMAVNFDRAWAATQQILSRFPVEKTDAQESSARAFLVTDWIEAKSDVLYHGFDRNRVPYSIRYKMYVYLQGQPGARGTRIRIRNVEQYRDDVVTAGVDFQGSLETWIRTDSSTLKENQLIEDIEKLALDRRFQPTSSN